MRALAGALAVWVLIVSAQDGGGPAQASASIATPLHAAALLDIDFDGKPDFANPTNGAVRGKDAYGAGFFGATRSEGRRHRLHKGADYVAAPGAVVWSPISGVVTKIGYAYGGDSVLRYIELTDYLNHRTARVLYIKPGVIPGQIISVGQRIGRAQDLAARYPGITNHVHVELSDRLGHTVDPATMLPSPPLMFAANAPTPVRVRSLAAGGS